MEQEINESTFQSAFTLPSNPIELYKILMKLTRPEFQYQIINRYAKYANNYSKVDEFKTAIKNAGGDRSYNESQGSTPKTYWEGSKRFELDRMKLERRLLENPNWTPVSDYERALLAQLKQ